MWSFVGKKADVVIIDLENPNRDMLEHFFALSRALQRPIAMFVDKSDIGSIEAAVEALRTAVSELPADGAAIDSMVPPRGPARGATSSARAGMPAPSLCQATGVPE